MLRRDVERQDAWRVAEDEGAARRISGSAKTKISNFETRKKGTEFLTGPAQYRPQTCIIVARGVHDIVLS